MEKVLNTAESPDTKLELINKNLYLGVSDRPTIHKISIEDVDSEEVRDLVIEKARSNYDEIEVTEKEGQELLILKSKS